jgi:ankyrin repeat protein
MSSSIDEASFHDLVIVDKDDIADYNEGNILPASLEEQAAILKWLQPTSYDADNGEYKKHLYSHMASTGEWVWRDDRFRSWLDSDENGLLWFRGIPGSGKSVLAASLINRLSQRDTPVLFFFFRQIIDANHAPVALLRDWLAQVLKYSPTLQAELGARMEKMQRIQDISMPDWWSLLRMGLTGLPKVYCVVDALDEMDMGTDYEEFIQELARLGQWRPSRVKIAATSRPVEAVKRPFRNMTILRISLEERLVDSDIEVYVKSRLLPSSISEEQQETIKRAAPGNANGLFLYARLAMDAFLKEGADVEQVLAALPLDLNVMYQNLLREHARRSGVSEEFQVLILSWATHATRPLRLLELADMLHVTQPELSSVDLKATKELVRTACGPLLEILADETICVVHHSLTEFLNGSARSKSLGAKNGPSSPYPILLKGTTHDRLAKACVSYILRSQCLGKVEVAKRSGRDQYGSWASGLDFDFNTTSNDHLHLAHHFLSYSMDNFDVHYRKAESEVSVSSDLLSGLADLFSTANLPSLATLLAGIVWPTTKVHVASKLGLAGLISQFGDDKEVDFNALDTDGETPLLLAAVNSHPGAVKVLLAGGARPDEASGYDGQRPLHHAATTNSGEIVDMLLSAGVDPMTKRTVNPLSEGCGHEPTAHGHTPLMYAMWGSKKAAALAFLSHLKDPDEVSQALVWAAEGGSEEILEAALRHPLADVNALAQGHTALVIAAQKSNVKAMLTLLKAGADPKILCAIADDEFGDSDSECHSSGTGLPAYNALHTFCGAFRKDWPTCQLEQEANMVDECLSLMIQCGLDIDARDKEHGKTALHYATPWSLTRVHALLRAGADAKIESNDGDTALHLCISGDVAKALVHEGGADIDKPRFSDSKSAFLAAIAREGSSSSVQIYLELGADVNATDNTGQGALHLLFGGGGFSYAREGLLEAVDGLLAAGARPGLPDNNGRTPLHMVPSLDEAIIRKLVAAGADINAPDHDGRTPLFYYIHYSTPSGMEEALDFLLSPSIGVRLDCRDGRGRTVLFPWTMERENGRDRYDITNALSIPNMAATINYLKKRGLDTKICDDEGNTFWHAAAIFGSFHQFDLTPFQSIVEASPDAKNKAGRSALHVHCGIGSLSSRMNHLGIFRDVDCKDNDGIRSLHIASRGSPTLVAQLLAAGASPAEPTFEGITPLHVAARFRQPNIIGMLLEAIAKDLGKTGLADYLNTAGGQTGPFVLQTACRSGIAESVALLLHAGAKPSSDHDGASLALSACLEFASEQRLWADCIAKARGDETKGQCCESLGIKSDDYARPIGPDDKTFPRLEDILFMLYENERSKFPGMGGHLVKDVEGALETGVEDDYTMECLLKLHHRLTDTSSPNIPTEGKFISARAVEEYAQHLSGKAEASYKPSEVLLSRLKRISAEKQALIETRPWKDLETQDYNYCGSSSPSGLLENLLVQHQWDAVCCMLRERPDLRIPIRYSGSYQPLIFQLVEWGFDDLVSILLTPDLVSNLESTYDKILSATEKQNARDFDPVLVVACRRPSGNMPMLHLLIEKLGVNINQRALETRGGGENMVVKESESALSVLSSGEYRSAGENWWQVAEGLPFLIKHGADLENDTPLMKAVQNTYGGDGVKRAARLLIEAGANVNATENTGRSCLYWATEDLEMTKLLVERGARIDARALLKAIRSGNVDILDLLCANCDVNMRRPEKNDKRKGVFTYEIEAHEQYPLHFAATLHPSPVKNRDRELQVRILLKHGADHFATFNFPRYKTNSKGEIESFSESTTVLHHLLCHHSVLRPFMEIPDLDLERRDSNGRTLLLAACDSKRGQDYSLEAIKVGRGKLVSGRDHCGLVGILLELGACPTARSKGGMNALHHILRGTKEGSHDSMRLLIERGGSRMVKEVDAAGDSPLHYAMDRSDGMYQGLDYQSIRLFLEHGADPLLLDSGGNSALHFVGKWLAEGSATGSEADDPCHLFKHFLSLGLPINGRNNNGETPLWCFMKSQCEHWRHYGQGKSRDETQKEALAIFVDAGADVFVRTDGGNTLLHVVAGQGDWLWDIDSRIFAADAEAQKGSRRRMLERFQWLRDQGLDVTAENDKSQTCVDVATYHRNNPILGLFREEK